MAGSGYLCDYLIGGVTSGALAGYVPCTTAELHVYADGTVGSNLNDGLTAATPKATIQAAFDLIPDWVQHNVCVHLSGTFTLPADPISLAKHLDVGTGWVYTLLIDGGSAVTVVDDNGGLNYTADIHSTSTIGVAAAGWTVNEHFGYMVEIVDGPCTGQKRTVAKNTASTITFNYVASGDVGHGTKFRIVRPATTIIGDPGLSAGIWNQCTGSGECAVQFQRLSLTTDGPCLVADGAGVITWIAQVVCTDSNVCISSWQTSGGLCLGFSTVNPVTFGSLASINGDLVGVGQTHTGGRIRVHKSGTVTINSSAIRYAQVENCEVSIGYGSTIHRCSLLNCKHRTNSMGITEDSSWGYCVTTIGPYGSGSGLTLKDSSMCVTKSVDFTGNSAHGIECTHSFLEFLGATGAVSSVANGGAGVYAHNNSTVLITNTHAPTLTGAAGDLAISDPTVADTTWAAIDAGTPISIMAEATIAREV